MAGEYLNHPDIISDTVETLGELSQLAVLFGMGALKNALVLIDNAVEVVDGTL